MRSDGRPTYNFASPVEDWLDGITHVIRGDDHISNTPKQIQILTALGSELPVYAHVPMINGPDGKKLSKRHGAVATDEFRDGGYLPEALMNFLALLGWAPDGETTIMSRDELVERFSLDRVGASSGDVRLREARLDERRLPPRRCPPTSTPSAWSPICASRATTGRTTSCGRRRRSSRRRSSGSVSSPATPASSSARSSQTRLCSTRTVLDAAAEALEALEDWDAAGIEAALKELSERLGLKPRQAFQPIRVAVTGSKVSPGLYESLELLGREESLARVRRAAEVAAAV